MCWRLIAIGYSKAGYFVSNHVVIVTMEDRCSGNISIHSFSLLCDCS